LIREKDKNFKEKEMSEDEKKENQKCCCCCQCFKAIVMAILLLVIGAAIGHVVTMMHCCPKMGPWSHHGMKACWDKGERERECGWENKFEEGKEICSKDKGLFGHKDDMGKCKPGCTCPKCSKKGADMPEAGKTGCPMTEQKSK
jgi:hypothetical protein